MDSTGAPGPRTMVAGLRCMHATSRIAFASTSAAHLLETTIASPDRCRTRLSREAGKDGERRLVWQFGASVWVTEPDQAESRALEPEERSPTIRELELRRALLLWPEGFEWELRDGRPSADLGPLGRLVAVTTTASGPPTSLAVVDPEGRETARFEGIHWEHEGERWRPGRLSFVFDQEVIWTETFLDFDTRTNYLDAWFQPPDRRRVGLPGVMTSVRSADLQSVVARRIQLEEDLSIEEALEREPVVRRGIALPEGALLDLDVRIELDRAARPKALVFIMVAGPPSPPTGWARVPGGSAVCRFVASLGTVRIDVLDELAQVAGWAGEWDEPVFLRVSDRGAKGRSLQLLLRQTEAEK